MKSTKKLLLFALLLPFTATPMPTAKTVGLKTALVASFLGLAYAGGKLTEKGTERFNQLCEKCTNTPKSIKGKELKKTWVKIAGSVIGVAGAYLLYKYVITDEFKKNHSTIFTVL